MILRYTPKSLKFNISTTCMLTTQVKKQTFTDRIETDHTLSSLSSKESEFGVHPIYLLELHLATNQRNPKTAV